MPDIAVLCRIFDPTPTDDLVTKRSEGVNTLVQAWKRKNNVEELLRIAAGVAAALSDPAALPQQIATEAVSHLSKNSPALVHQDHELEIAACSAAALLAWIESSTPVDGHPLTTAACVASGLWSAMALQTPSANSRLEALRQQLFTAARECVLGFGRATRERTVVPAFKIELKEDEAGDQTKVLKRVEKAAEASISALRENAIRDREELDLLWWVIGDYSEILQKPLSQASEIPRAVVAALEISLLTRRLPSESEKHLAVRHVRHSEPITFQAVIQGLAGDRDAIAKSCAANARVSRFPTVFPLLSAIASDEHTVDATKALPLVEWAKHIVLEGCNAAMTLDIRPET